MHSAALVFEKLFDPPLIVLADLALLLPLLPFMDEPPIELFNRLPEEAPTDLALLLLDLEDPPNLRRCRRLTS